MHGTRHTHLKRVLRQNLDTVSLLVDYRPVKRIDVYAGVAVSNVYPGLANGFQQTQNIDPTAGFRIKF